MSKEANPKRGSNNADESTSAKSAKMPAPQILVLHGPNLNLLGRREPAIYGSATLADIHANMDALARAHGVQIESYQSNSEGDLIDRIQAAAAEGIQYIIINPGAYSHTVLQFPTRSEALPFPILKCTFPTFTHGKPSAITPTSRRVPLA